MGFGLNGSGGKGLVEHGGEAPQIHKNKIGTKVNGRPATVFGLQHIGNIWVILIEAASVHHA